MQLVGLEPTRENSHYPLKVARLPIPPQLHIKQIYGLKFMCLFLSIRRTLYIIPQIFYLSIVFLKIFEFFMQCSISIVNLYDAIEFFLLFSIDKSRKKEYNEKSEGNGVLRHLSGILSAFLI